MSARLGAVPCGGVAWAPWWNPAPSAAPRARCLRGLGVLIVVASWSRAAARGSGTRAVLARPSGRWPAGPGGLAGEGIPRRLGAGRDFFFRRGVGPVLDRSPGDAYGAATARASMAS